jgi:hypothetical protein
MSLGQRDKLLLNAVFIFESTRDSGRVNAESNDQSETELDKSKPKQSTIEWALDHPADVATVLIAAFNGLLVYVTYRLVESTNRLWEAGEQQLNITTSTFSIEGPFLHPIIQGNTIHEAFKYFIMYDHPTSPGTPVNPVVSFAIKNVGRSPALPRYIASTIELWTRAEPEPYYNFTPDYVIDPVIEAGTESKTTFSQMLKVEIDKASFELIRMEKRHLFLFGEIAFSDVSGTDYIQRFGFYYDFRSKMFVRAGAKYNGRRLEQTDENHKRG